jgi:hypothetical protein
LHGRKRVRGVLIRRRDHQAEVVQPPAQARIGQRFHDCCQTFAALAEFVPGYEATGWGGVSAPRDTPAPIVDKLNREINAALADQKMIARIIELGASPMSGSPADYAKLVADDTEKWGKVVKLSGARVD